jgi:hypothetical protein
MKLIQKFHFSTSETILKKYANYRERHFVDRLKLTIIAGKGGNGCVCYFR